MLTALALAASQSSSLSYVAVATATASPSGGASALVPTQAALPPKQAWCPSEIFCAGALLQTLHLAHPYDDPKTIVDKPTAKTSKAVLADFAKLPGNGSITEGQVVDFLDSDFQGEGRELQAMPLPGFKESPAFLKNTSDPLVKAFSQTVHGFWTQLIRGTNESTLCTHGECESSLIPLNHTFVVPGGRFREQYYWDSFWIVEGLIASELYDIVNATLQNFMDEIENFGFIPNGGRIYYLNRSQPPFFIQMLARYVAASKDTAILKRALPLAEAELTWWETNRTSKFTSPFTNKTHSLAQYSVTNSAPRPESYYQDYMTVHDPAQPQLNASQAAVLYGELASGAETGWDYSAPPVLRSLNIKNTVPVDLNSILYKNRIELAKLYGTNKAAASRHLAAAAAIKAGVLDLFWDAKKLAFYDFNIAGKKRNDVFTVATYYPFWAGIIPKEVLASSANAFGAFASMNMVLNRYNGTLPVTFIETGTAMLTRSVVMYRDAPSAWPPHQHLALAALRALPANVTTGPIPTPPEGQGSFALVPAGQLGLEEAQLPVQSIDARTNASASGAAADISRGANGTVMNGGKATKGGWAEALGSQLANRYFASTLCSWHATGGEIPGVLPRLSDAELGVTQSTTNTGNAGFGWTNGVLLWVASNYGDSLVAPACPNLLDITTGGSSASVSGTSTAPPGPSGSGGGGSTGGAVGTSVPVVGVLIAAVFAWVAL
ncbi:trehalase [Mycena rebaudengoi]|nr:trehalase [Mycena rebaudengoi]